MFPGTTVKRKSLPLSLGHSNQPQLTLTREHFLQVLNPNSGFVLNVRCPRPPAGESDVRRVGEGQQKEESRKPLKGRAGQACGPRQACGRQGGRAAGRQPLQQHSERGRESSGSSSGSQTNRHPITHVSRYRRASVCLNKAGRTRRKPIVPPSATGRQRQQVTFSTLQEPSPGLLNRKWNSCKLQLLPKFLRDSPVPASTRTPDGPETRSPHCRTHLWTHLSASPHLDMSPS